MLIILFFPLLFFKSLDSIKKNFPLEFACLVFLKPKFWLTLAWHKKNWISLHTSLNQNHYNGDIWQSQNPELRSVEIFCHHKDYGSRGITSRRKTKKKKPKTFYNFIWGKSRKCFKSFLMKFYCWVNWGYYLKIDAQQRAAECQEKGFQKTLFKFSKQITKTVNYPSHIWECEGKVSQEIERIIKRG